MRTYSKIFLIFFIGIASTACPTPPTSGGAAVETPQISPPAGLIEQDTAQITITCVTSGVAIHFTDDDTPPNAASPPYAAPIAVSAYPEGALHIKAVAVSGDATSAVASADYSVTDNTGPVPVISSGNSGGTNAPTFDVTVTFNEQVVGFDQSDLTISNGSVVGFAEDNPVFIVTVEPDVVGDVTVEIKGSDSTPATPVCTDTSTNLNENVKSNVFSIYYDPNAPLPTITSTAPNPTNTSPIPITVTFDRDVTGFDISDLIIGNGTASNFAGGPAVYTADVTPEGQGSVSADIDAAVCTSTTGSPNTAAVQFGIVYDTISPTVTVDQAATQNDPANGTINFTVVFSEPVSDFASGDVTLSGTAGADTATVTGSGTTYDVAVSGMTGDGTVIVTLAAGVAHDTAGNANVASTSTDNTVTYDGTPPTVTCNQAVGQADPTNAAPINFTVVFSEPVSDFASGDATVTGTAGGTKTATVTGSDTTYNVAVSGMTGAGTVIVSLAAGVAHDAAGNPSAASTSTDNTVNFDDSGLNVSINQAGGQADPVNSGPINFTVVFSKPVSDFATGDVTVTGTAGGTKTATVTGSGTTYNVAVTGMTDGTVIAAIASGVAHDALNNPNTASTSTDNSVTYDATAPGLTLSSTDPNPTNTGFTVTFAFTEAVSGFTASDIVFTAGSGSASVPSTSNNITWTSIISPSAQGTITVTVNAGAVLDSAGNANTAAADSVTRTYDSVAPTVTCNQASGQADPTGTSPINFTVVFSESVSDFATGDVTVTGTAGGAKTATVTGSGTTYNVAVSGMTTDGTVIASIAQSMAHDAAGNGNAASASTDHTVGYDGTPPTLSSFSPVGGGYFNTAPYTLTINFSETVVGFSATKISVTNATKGTFTAVSGSQYTIQLTGPTQGAGVQVTLSGAGVTDNAGNAYAGGDDWFRTYDSIAPTLSSFSPASGGHFIASPYTLTINFSETVVGFSAARITVTNASKGTFTAVSGSQYTIQLTNPTDRSNVQVTLSGTGVTDNAGNAYAGGASWSRIYRSKFIGCVIADSVPSSWNTYWDQVTPENGGKWGSVESTRDSMNYGSLDVAYNHGVNNGFDFKEHCLVWGSQYPSWITSLSAADQRDEVEEWIADYFSTHPDTALVDVVNEPIKTSCPFAAALGGAGSTGYDWVVWSFQKAKIYAGGSKCLINEYGTENDPPVRSTYKTIINILKGYGVIDGIGIQCHSFNLDYMSANQMQTCLDDLGGLGLPIYVSELDIRGQSGTNNDTTQRAQYQALFPVIYGHSAVKGITFWGYEYGIIWQTNAELLNSSGAERPAMTWLRQQNYVGGN